MTRTLWTVLVRSLTLAGAGLFMTSIATAQVEPPEPPADSNAGAARPNDYDQRESTLVRDNSTTRATERYEDRGEPSSAERTQPRTSEERPESARDDEARDSSRGRQSTFDDPQEFRDAAQETQRTSRDEFSDRTRDFDRPSSRDREFGRDTRDGEMRRDDSNTRFVPDPRPGRMSESQASGDFDLDRVRSADIGLWFDRSTADGLVINDVGSGAISRLGLREGDRIYSVNGARVDSEAAFVRMLFDPRWRNQRVHVIIYCHGRPWTVYVQPGVLVEEYATVAYDPLDEWGLVLDDRYDYYVVVWRVRPRSPAFYSGLRAGDVIVNWQGRRLAGPDDFVRLASQSRLSDVSLDISRNRQTWRIDLDLSDVGARTSARTSLRPDFDAGAGVGASVRGRADLDDGAPVRAGTGTRVEADPNAGPRTGRRFETRSVEVPGIPSGVRGQGSTRSSMFGGRRP